jgi:hypothetical protein
MQILKISSTSPLIQPLLTSVLKTGVSLVSNFSQADLVTPLGPVWELKIEKKLF